MAMHDWVRDYGVVYGNSGFLPGRREQVWLDK
jgi:hypothetical protein